MECRLFFPSRTSTTALTVAALVALTLGKLPRSAAADEKFEWRVHPEGRLDLYYGGRPAVSYMHQALDESTPAARQATFKPYHHLFSPDGTVQLTNGAGAGLYPHHLGVFYGFNNITCHGDKKCDVWHCLEKAHQSHKETLFYQSEYEVGPHVHDIYGRHGAAIDWHDAEGEVFAHERRVLKVSRPTEHGVDGWFIEFASHLETADGHPIHLDGDPQHAGFHFRAAPEEMANLEPQENAAKQIYFLRTDGQGAIGETRNWDRDHPDAPENAQHINHPWTAMSFMLHGKRYTVLYLDHPDNPKPARSSERAYGRFGTYFVADVTQEKPLDVKYALWVQDGEMTVDQCQALSDGFVAAK